MSAIESFSINEKSSCEREITVTVGNLEVAKQYNSMAKKAQQSASIKGFRAGKVPLEMVKKLFKDKIRKELISGIIESTVGEICKNNNIFPVSQTELEPFEEFAEDKDFTFKVKFQIKPNIDIKNFENLNIELTNFVFDESDVDFQLEKIREECSWFSKPERNELTELDLAIGDVQVKIDNEFSKEREIKGHMIPLYSKELPDFMKVLIGKKIGDEVIMDYEITMPHDHSHEHTSDCSHEDEKKVAQLYFNITDIKEINVPNLDDDFAKDVSDKFQTLEELKETIRISFNNNKRQNDFLQKKYALTQALISNNDFEVPSALVQRIAMSIVDEMINTQNTKKLSKTEVENMLKNNWHEIWPQALERASFQIKSELIYENLINKLNIPFDNEVVAKLIKNNKMSLDEAEFSAKVDNLLKFIEEKSNITVVDKPLLNKGN